MESSMQWLHADHELLASCQSYKEYCEKRKAKGDGMADYYAKLDWLAGQFPYAKRGSQVNP